MGAQVLRVRSERVPVRVHKTDIQRIDYLVCSHFKKLAEEDSLWEFLYQRGVQQRHNEKKNSHEFEYVPYLLL